MALRVSWRMSSHIVLSATWLFMLKLTIGGKGEGCGALERAASGIWFCVKYRCAMGEDPMMSRVQYGRMGDGRSPGTFLRLHTGRIWRHMATCEL